MFTTRTLIFWRSGCGDVANTRIHACKHKYSFVTHAHVRRWAAGQITTSTRAYTCTHAPTHVQLGVSLFHHKHARMHTRTRAQKHTRTRIHPEPRLTPPTFPQPTRPQASTINSRTRMLAFRCLPPHPRTHFFGPPHYVTDRGSLTPNGVSAVSAMGSSFVCLSESSSVKEKEENSSARSCINSQLRDVTSKCVDLR